METVRNCIFSSAGTTATFAITDTKLFALAVTLKIKDNAKLSKLLSDGCKRSVYWNKYQAILKDQTESKNIRERLDASFQGVNKLLVLAYARGDNVANENSHRRYFLPRFKTENCNIETDGRDFYDQSINDWIKQYDEISKILIGQGDDYTNGCLLDFAYFEKNYRLIAADLSKQKALDADSRAIQQIIFTGKASAAVIIYYILEQSKETILEFSKGTTKVF